MMHQGPHLFLLCSVLHLFSYSAVRNLLPVVLWGESLITKFFTAPSALSSPLQQERENNLLLFCLFPSLHGPQIKPSWPFVPLAHTYPSGEHSCTEESGICFGLVFHLFLDSKKAILFVRAVKNGEANCCCSMQ